MRRAHTAAFVGLVVASLVTTAVLPANAAERSVRTAGLFVPLAGSGLLRTDDATGPTVVTGELVDASGSPAPAGSNVLLQAWPTSDVLAAIPVGQDVPLQPLVEGQTDADGRFSLALPTADAADEFANSANRVSYEVDGETDDDQGNAVAEYSYAFTSTAPDLSDPSFVPRPTDIPHPGGTPDPIKSTQPIGPQVVSNAAISAAATLPFDEGAQDPAVPDVVVPVMAATTTSTTVEGVETNKQGEATTDDIGAPDDKAISGGCTTTYVKSEGKKAVAVGSSYLETSDVTAKVSYLEGSNTDVGVGVSGSGAKGSWSVSGTYATSADAKVTFATRSTKGNTIDWAYYFFGEYKYHCTIGGVSRTSYSIRPNGFFGTAAYTAPATTPATPAKFCGPEPKNTSLTVDSSRAVTWSAGVNFMAALDLDLTARSGYDSRSSMTYTVTKAHTLCGTTGPPAHPGRLVAKP